MNFSKMNIFLCLLMVLSINLVLAQQEMTTPKSAYEMFLSDFGTMITKDYFDMPKLESSYKKISVKIIRLSSGKGIQYFLSFSAKSEYSNKTAVIAQDDLKEISKALTTIIEKSKNESTQNIEYRESYFSTNDGFKVGYFQKGLKQTFFIDLDDYQSDDTFFFDNFESLQKSIDEVKSKINALSN